MYLFLSGFIWYFLRNLLLMCEQIMRNGGQCLSPAQGDWLSRDFSREHYSGTACGAGGFERQLLKRQSTRNQFLPWAAIASLTLCQEMICKFSMPALSLSQPFPAPELSCSPRKVMKGEVARQLQSTTCHGGCGAQSPAGQWKVQDFLYQFIKACKLLRLFQKFESSIVPTTSGSWIILGFGVDNHTTQVVLNPINSSLDRVIFNSSAKRIKLEISECLLYCGTWSKPHPPPVWWAAPGCWDMSWLHSAPYWMNTLHQGK